MFSKNHYCTVSHQFSSKLTSQLMQGQCPEPGYQGRPALFSAEKEAPGTGQAVVPQQGPNGVRPRRGAQAYLGKKMLSTT